MRRILARWVLPARERTPLAWILARSGRAGGFEFGFWWRRGRNIWGRSRIWRLSSCLSLGKNQNLKFIKLCRDRAQQCCAPTRGITVFRRRRGLLLLFGGLRFLRSRRAGFSLDLSKESGSRRIRLLLTRPSSLPQIRRRPTRWCTRGCNFRAKFFLGAANHRRAFRPALGA